MGSAGAGATGLPLPDALTPTEFPTEPPTEAPTEAPTESPTEPPTDPPTDPPPIRLQIPQRIRLLIPRPIPRPIRLLIRLQIPQLIHPRILRPIHPQKAAGRSTRPPRLAIRPVAMRFGKTLSGAKRQAPCLMFPSTRAASSSMRASAFRCSWMCTTSTTTRL